MIQKTRITRRLCILAPAPILALSLMVSLMGGTGHAAGQDPGQVLKEAVQLADEGKYEEALQKHLWYHEHAVEADRSQSGVRVSFALSYWADLARKYPKALDALKGVRDQGAARLLKGEGDWSLLFEVDSINDNLGEPGATVELFRKIDAANPEFAKSIYQGAHRKLVSQGEYALARKYMRDPSEQLDLSRRSLELARNRQGDLPPSALRASERMFAEEIVRVITVLAKTGDRERALEIQAEALKLVDSPAIRDAVQ